MDVLAGKLRADISVLGELKRKAIAAGNNKEIARLENKIAKIKTAYKKIPKWNRIVSKMKYKGGKKNSRVSQRKKHFSKRKRTRKNSSVKRRKRKSTKRI